MPDEKIFLIILNWNGKEDTLACLQSIRAITLPHRVLLVDNGSTDDSVLAIRKNYPEVLVIETGKNLGYAEGNNVGIRAALRQGATFLLLLNNDTIVDKEILAAFLAAYKKHPLSILGAKSYLHKEPNRIDHLGGRWNRKKVHFTLIAHNAIDNKKWNKIISLDYVCGCALFTSAEVFHKVGEFDPRFFLFWEESDWCFRAKKQNIFSFSCPEAKLQHKVSASFTGGQPHKAYFWWRNRLLFLEKNFSKKERLYLAFTTLFPEIGRLLRHYCTLSIQCAWKRNRQSQKKSERKALFAALSGVKDYLFRHFYHGPSWLTLPLKKPKKNSS